MDVYTDGSCEPNPGPGGWAFVVFNGAQEVVSFAGAEPATTNNRMEMMAVLETLRWLDGRPARILSDSQYVVKGVMLWTPGWKRSGWKRKEKGRLLEVKNADLWQAIDAARAPGQVLQWVRGHNGDPGNERADELANEARWTLGYPSARRSTCKAGRKLKLDRITAVAVNSAVSGRTSAN